MMIAPAPVWSLLLRSTDVAIFGLPATISANVAGLLLRLMKLPLLLHATDPIPAVLPQFSGLSMYMYIGVVREAIWIVPPPLISSRQKKYVLPLSVSTPPLLTVRTRVVEFQLILLHVLLQESLLLPLLLIAFVIRWLSFGDARLRSTGWIAKGWVALAVEEPEQTVLFWPLVKVLPG